jgi:hypothetical protein
MISRLIGLFPSLLFVLLISVSGNIQAASIVIQNGDGPNEGFNDTTSAVPVGGNPGTTLGEQRLYVFQEAANIWGQVLNSSVSVIVEANFDVMSCGATSAVLGGAGPIYVVRDFPNAPLANTWYHVALGNALAGSDQVPSGGDIVATFNSAIDNNNNCLNGTNWYLGVDHNQGGDIDLLVVLLHEIGHGLGFSTLINGSLGSWFNGLPDAYGSLIRDNDLGLLWTQMSSGQRRTSAVNSGNLVWDGSQVTAASGLLATGKDASGRVKLFAPNPIQGGSSISHWDTSASPSLLMEPYITSNIGSDLDLTDEQMADVGWSIVGGPVCGNGALEAGEDCDGTDLGGASCSDFGYASGSLQCTAQCTRDQTLCSGSGSSCNSNSSCDIGESCSTCPGDCNSGSISGASCGNGMCEGGDGENCLTCPQDCAGKQNGKKQDRFCCGAVGGENNVGCNLGQCGSSLDCTLNPVPAGGTYCCGDTSCEGEENSLNCSIDCGSCTQSELTETTCDDGLDNDCDGATDGDDSDCTATQCSGKEKGKRCSDGIDNDCDGLTDGADTDCN